MKTKTKILYSVSVILSVLLLLFTTILGVKTDYAAAETSDGISFDSTYVMDDLVGSTVDGAPFNLKDYAFDKNKPTKIFSFVEYCYSFNATKQDNYGLYVYLYNPQGINFDFDSVQNKIQLAVGAGATGYQKYSLQFLNCSRETNYEGLFIKYKIVLSEARKEEVLSALNSTERTYRVSGIELLTEGNANATDYPATGVVTADNKGSVIYNYSGYSAGYGANPEAESTLTVNSTEGDVLSLEVHHTSWREKGVTNGKDQYTQDSLNSVYFAIPKTIVKKYGYLSEVHAEWRNAVTSWGVVTGNYEAYQKLYNFVGRDIGKHNNDIGYTLTVDYNPGYTNTAYMAYNCFSDCEVENLITQINWLFSAGDELNIADHTSIPSETLKTWYEREFRNIVGDNYGETFDCKDGVKIYNALFESVDDEIKDYHISADEEKTLVSQKWTQSSWDKFWGNSPHKDGDAVPTNVECIRKVTDDDFGTDKTATCDSLYISISDYDDFRKFYDDNKSENNIYLMRFAKTDYKAIEAKLGEYFSITVTDEGFKEIDTNNYFYKQNVFLDFDIIDVTFDNGKVKTVIPVVSSPIDIFPEATPPVLTTEDKPKTDWDKIWKIVQIVLVAILFIVVFSLVVRFIRWVVGSFHKKE